MSKRNQIARDPARRRFLGRALGAACAVGSFHDSQAQLFGGAALRSTDDSFLRWPSPDKRYDSISLERLRDSTGQLAAISRRYRDAGHPQFWGRLAGTEGHDWASDWLVDQFKAIGLSNIQNLRLDMVPLTMPDRWSVRMRSAAETFDVSSAVPSWQSQQRNFKALELKNLELVWVGLGSPLDFAGRDVRGKAVLLESIPRPGFPFGSTAGRYGAIASAARGGAALVLGAISIPGNQSGQALWGNSTVPVVTIGSDDLQRLRQTLEKAPAGDSPRIDFSMTTTHIEKPKTSQVMAELPGQTDENILIFAHMDGYYEACYDNAAGTAGMLELARFYAAMPRSQRRRTLYFVSTPGHHEPHRIGTQWLAHNWADRFAKMALLMNIEHPSYVDAQYTNEGLVLGNMPGANMWYAGGSPRLQQIAMDNLQRHGVTLNLRPMGNPQRRNQASNPNRLSDANTGPEITSPAGEGADIGHLAPFFQIIGAAWPQHSNADTMDAVHWPGLVNAMRAHANIIDDINRVDIADLRSPLHPRTAPAG